MNAPRSDRTLVHDEFEQDLTRGRVLGSRAADGSERRGVDRHRSLAVDHGALRIVSLPDAGWDSTALAYEPVAPARGTALAALVLNGHNTAQHEPLGEPISTRFKRWMKGNEVEPWWRHVLRWTVRGRRRWTLRRFAQWVRVDRAARRGTLRRLDENFAVALAPTVPSDPTRVGNAFVMHATGADNGELWIAAGGRTRAVLADVRNVPLFLAMVIRGDDVVYYAASVDGTAALPEAPLVRPLAVAPLSGTGPLSPVIQQAVSSQIGFAADTRVWEVRVAEVPSWLDDGPPWSVASDVSAGDRRTFDVGAAGLIRVVTGAAVDPDVEIEWGAAERGWVLRLARGSWRLGRRAGDRIEPVAEANRPGAGVDVQIVDDGLRVGVFAGDEPVFGGWSTATDQPDAEAADTVEAVDTVTVDVAAGSLERIEVHPRRCPLPSLLRPSSTVPRAIRSWSRELVDEFDGPAAELAGREVGGRTWSRSVGAGRFLVSGSGDLRVDATAANPMPGRVVYSLPHPGSGPIELEIDVMPPGDRRNTGERGRAGLVFEQNDGDCLIVATWLDDEYDGASISSFFRLGGFEDLYDAIWTNVGGAITWGRPYRLRVAFDGLVYEAWVDDELVLYRSLVDVDPDTTPLQIARVGIVANWEWGTDTGSVVRRFRARWG